MEVKEVAKQAAKETFKFYKTRKFWISFILWMVCLTAFNHYAPHKNGTID